MKNATRLSALTAMTFVAGALVAPAQLGAQTTPICDGQPATIVGTAGDDVLEGTPGNDVIFAAQGDDIIFGYGGDDIVCAGKGDDIVVGGQGFDIIFGAQGNDVLFAADGSSEADRKDTRGARIFGGAGDDLIVGSSRWDRMQGGLGVDNLAGYEGQDWMRGGGDGDFLDGGANVDDMHGGNGHDRMRSTTNDSVRGSNGNDLCELNGTPAKLLSCTENAEAFATARHMPVVPPTESGVIQMASYQTELINQRANVKYEDVWATECNHIDAATMDEWDTFNDEQLGAGWSIDLSIDEILQVKGHVAIADQYLRFFDARGTQLADHNQDEVYAYERGAWRATNC